MASASSNQRVLEDIFTVEEVACALSGVSCRAEDPAQVSRRERDLMNAIQRRLLPAHYAYVDNDQNLVDWQATTVTRQALLDWCKTRGVSLTTLVELASMSHAPMQNPSKTPAHPSTQMLALTPPKVPDAVPEAPDFSESHSRSVLLKVIAGLTLLLVDKSSPRYRKSEAELDQPQLQKHIHSALDKVRVAPEENEEDEEEEDDALSSLDDDFYEELLEIIHLAKSSDHSNPPSASRRRNPR